MATPQKGEASHQGAAPAYRDNLLCTLHPTLRTSWCILIASSSHSIDAPFILLRWTIHHTRRNTEFPAFPDWANPTALVTLCDDLNTLHAADPTTNPATCLGFHSGPWVSIFGLNIDQPGPHLPEGTEWKAWDEGSGTIDLTGTKPNHQYVCYIKGNLCPGGVDPAPAGTAACKPEWPTTRHLAGLVQASLCQPVRNRRHWPCAHAKHSSF